MIIGKLRYWDIGRTKAKGELNIIAKDEEDFNKQLHDEFCKYLISSNIGFANGKVFAGFHSVGEFEFIVQEVEPKE